MKSKENISSKILSGLFWKFAERIIAQGISFVISLALARMLMPEEYGTIALVLVFINIANVFVSSGLGESLIQKKDSDDADFSTIFYCSLGLGIILYVILFIVAPYISRFYDNEELIMIIRILSLQIPLSSVKTIQQAYVSKHMLFHKFFFSTLGGTIVSGVIGVIMAYNGFGVWALVEQYLVNSLIDMTILFFTIDWRPKLIFKKESAKSLISYGWKLLVAQLINIIYSEIRSLIIGKVYSEEDLAYYNRGNHFPSLIINNINASISSVLFPAMSNVNNNIEKIKEITRKSMRMTSYVIFPMMIGMIAVAKPLIKVLLTDKWMMAVPFLQLSCLYWMFQPCQTANVQAIKATGRSDICLRLEIIKKIIGFSLVVMTMFINVYAVVASNVLFAAISSILNIFPNKKLINYGFSEQIKDLLPALLLSLFMGSVVYCINIFNLSGFLTLILQVVIGFCVYLLTSYFFKIEEFKDILKILKKMIKK